jgi:hypothetical protein
VFRVHPGREARELEGKEATESMALLPLGGCCPRWLPSSRASSPWGSGPSPRPVNTRCGSSRGWVYLLDQKLQVRVPRAEPRGLPRHVRRLPGAPAADTSLFRQTRRGLSCGQYRETTEAVPEAFGLSPSTVSRRFIRASARKLQAAYAQPTYADAKAALGRLAKELQLVNPSAVESLQESLEETVTLHRLGLAGTLGASLQTTNCLESIFASVEQRTAKVDHWRTND